VSAIDLGPECPACGAPFDANELRAGAVQCPHCRRFFEATPFQPREQRHAVVQVVTETPDGVAAACANHARNAAVTSCSRCGLFICALCEMNAGDATYCPSCFDRVRSEGTATGVGARYRDFASMALSAAVFGVPCIFFGFPGALAVYWAYKGMQQRRMEGLPRWGMVVTMIVGILEVAASVGMIGLMIVGMVTEASS
jgi:uncharacterized paraquat-inducible protein A